MSTNKFICFSLKFIKVEYQKYKNFISNTKISIKYQQILLRKDLHNFSKEKFLKIEDFCFEIMRKISALSLQSYGHCFGAGTVVQPVEA